MKAMREGDLLLLDKEARRSLRALVRELNIGGHDLLLVGDGSGEDYLKPAGWCCIAYDRLLKRAIVHAGMVTTGTNNFAELIPYWHALWFFSQEHKDERPRGYKVAIVSDSEITVRCGNKQYQRKANLSLWTAIEWFERQAYVFHWHHVRRLTNVWNKLADAVAGQIRSQCREMQEVLEETVGGFAEEVGD
jgi:ribonuclease HI